MRNLSWPRIGLSQEKNHEGDLQRAGPEPERRQPDRPEKGVDFSGPKNLQTLSCQTNQDQGENLQKPELQTVQFQEKGPENLAPGAGKKGVSSGAGHRPRQARFFSAGDWKNEGETPWIVAAAAGKGGIGEWP